MSIRTLVKCVAVAVLLTHCAYTLPERVSRVVEQQEQNNDQE